MSTPWRGGFSRAAAEVLTRMTGSEFFPGGMATFSAPAGAFLEFEHGPSVDVVLQWATYYDAADEAGVSRLYGGIHVPADDGPGRIMGAQCGISAWALASRYFDGSILDERPTVTLEASDGVNYRLRWSSLRGMDYTLQSSGDLQAFSDLLPVTRAETEQGETSLSIPGAAKLFFRVRQE